MAVGIADKSRAGYRYKKFISSRRNFCKSVAWSMVTGSNFSGRAACIASLPDVIGPLAETFPQRSIRHHLLDPVVKILFAPSGLHSPSLR